MGQGITKQIKDLLLTLDPLLCSLREDEEDRETLQIIFSKMFQWSIERFSHPPQQIPAHYRTHVCAIIILITVFLHCRKHINAYLCSFFSCMLYAYFVSCNSIMDHVLPSRIPSFLPCMLTARHAGLFPFVRFNHISHIVEVNHIRSFHFAFHRHFPVHFFWFLEAHWWPEIMWDHEDRTCLQASWGEAASMSAPC
jgi:hypothetical protein